MRENRKKASNPTVRGGRSSYSAQDGRSGGSARVRRNGRSGRGGRSGRSTYNGRGGRERAGAFGTISYDNDSGGIISRRTFVIGAGCATAAAIGATAFGVSRCSAQRSQDAALLDPANVGTAGATASASMEPISVAADAVFTTDDCELLESTDGSLERIAQASLPYGTILWASDADIAACLLPSETSNPLTQVGLMSLSDGSMSKVLESAVGANEGFEIYDVRANASGMAWVEADILNGKWRLYSVRLKGRELAGTPQMTAEGDSDWSSPVLCVSGNNVFWQMSPKKGGQAADEPSTVMRAAFGSSADGADMLLATSGSFPCDMSPTASGVAVASLVAGKKSTYQLLHIDGSGGETIDQMVLPQTMKPTYVSYGENRFSFAFEGIYSTGDGISNLGTYTPASDDATGDWFRFPRTPFTTPAWMGGWFMVKSTSAVAGVDPASKRYFTIKPENATQGYGEFLATQGSAERIVTYSNIDYTPLNGQRINECNVRIWVVC